MMKIDMNRVKDAVDASDLLVESIRTPIVDASAILNLVGKYDMTHPYWHAVLKNVLRLRNETVAMTNKNPQYKVAKLIVSDNYYIERIDCFIGATHTLYYIHFVDSKVSRICVYNNYSKED